MKTKTFSLLTILVVLLFLTCKNATPTPSGQEESVVNKKEELYKQKGKAIATATFTSLSGQLQKAIKDGGVPNALEYCNLAALPLVDSLSKVHKATIRRTSLKVRNPKDSPTALEAKVLLEYANQFQNGEELKAMVLEVDTQTNAFFAPIMLNEFCLQCHGKVGKTLSAENYQIIQKIYPQDKAIGYVTGDLRGIWSIQFYE
jgi:replication fork clamp-binding protein CrfC